MRFLADENVALSVILSLRNAGYEVFDVKQTKLQGKADKDLISFAVKKRCIILSHDKDFLEQHKVSVILIRFRNQSPHQVTKHLLAFFKSKHIRKFKKVVTLVLTEYSAEFHYSLE